MVSEWEEEDQYKSKSLSSLGAHPSSRAEVKAAVPVPETIPVEEEDDEEYNRNNNNTSRRSHVA